jgi:hypothetical protein
MPQGRVSRRALAGRANLRWSGNYSAASAIEGQPDLERRCGANPTFDPKQAPVSNTGDRLTVRRAVPYHPQNVALRDLPLWIAPEDARS